MESIDSVSFALGVGAAAAVAVAWEFIQGFGALARWLAFGGWYRAIDPYFLNLSIDSHWMTLGLWPPPTTPTAGDNARGMDARLSYTTTTAATSYAKACEALAKEVGDAAALAADDRLLDVGFGCGEQLFVWWKHYGCRRIDGVNITPREVEIAQRRLDAATGATAANERPEITLVVGSATELPASLACSGRVDARCGEGGGGRYSKVISLDSAYHYDTRDDFFEQAFACLEPGGRLVLADLCLTDSCRTAANGSFWRRACLRLGCRLVGIPPANAYDRRTYEQRLESAGFGCVTIRAVEDRVFRPFADFVERHELRMRPAVASPPSGFGGTAALLRFVARKELLHFVIVTADKPSATS